MNRTVEVVRERERESYNLKKYEIEYKFIAAVEKVNNKLINDINTRIGYLENVKEKKEIKRIKLLQDSLSFL